MIAEENPPLLLYKKNDKLKLVVFCERAVKMCVNTGKNEEKVRQYTVRQIGIYRYNSILISYLSSMSI